MFGYLVVSGIRTFTALGASDLGPDLWTKITLFIRSSVTQSFVILSGQIFGQGPTSLKNLPLLVPK
jgi:hypothetical protein